MPLPLFLPLQSLELAAPRFPCDPESQQDSKHLGTQVNNENIHIYFTSVPKLGTKSLCFRAEVSKIIKLGTNFTISSKTKKWTVSKDQDGGL